MSIPGHRQGTLQSWEGRAKSSNSPHQISLVEQRCSQVLRITVTAKEAAVAPACEAGRPTVRPVGGWGWQNDDQAKKLPGASPLTPGSGSPAECMLRVLCRIQCMVHTCTSLQT